MERMANRTANSVALLSPVEQKNLKHNMTGSLTGLLQRSSGSLGLTGQLTKASSNANVTESQGTENDLNLKGVSEESYDTVPVKEVSVRPNDVRILNVRVNEPEDRL